MSSTTLHSFEGWLLFAVSSLLIDQLRRIQNNRQNTQRMQTKTYTLSAPGKALIAGGYLVLDGGIGVTIASSSRFFSTIKCLKIERNSSAPQELRIVIESPQFHSQFIFAYNFSSFTLTLLSKSGNEFIEKCLSLFFSFASIHFGTTQFISILSGIASTGELGLKLRADNDFYSQVEQLRSLGKPFLSSSLRELPRFVPCPLDPTTGRVRVVKTGMGSSAAMTTALVASLLQYFGIVHLPTADIAHSNIESSRNDCDSKKDRSLLHNLAQLAHAIAQGKIGSGFDVAAAVYGSQLYQRFAAEPFASVMEPGASATEIFTTVNNTSAWAQVIKPLTLPSSLQLMMADVCGGTESVSMARQVLKWRKDKPVEASEIWNQLLDTNSQIAHCLVKLANRINGLTPYTLSVLQTQLDAGVDWTIPDSSIAIEECRAVRQLLTRARSLLKRMGECAGVGIEPDDQTRLANATELVPGVLCAGVPGAGGVDAVFCLVLTPTAREKVELLWSTWKDVSGAPAIVCPLMLQADSGSVPLGTRVEPSIQWE